jgi:glycosyltransferase involved in cell wall biosynthesis
MTGRGQPRSALRRVALVGPSAAGLVRLRGALIRDLVAARHPVLCLVPDLTPRWSAAIAELGAEAGEYPLRTGGVHLLADRQSITALAARLADWRAQVVMGYHPKPMLLAALAGQRAGAERIVALVSSLGDALLDGADPPGWGWRRLYRSGLGASHAVVFHNPNDGRTLVELGLLEHDTPSVVVAGAGVDIAGSEAQPMPPHDDGLVFLMIAALDRLKGVIEYCEAARRVRERSPGTRFRLAGSSGAGATALSRGDLAAYAGVVEVLGDVEDTASLLAACHVFVLPSYAEGMPRAVLEALAAGRPILTTNVAGCRETVDERINGVLVPPRDAAALAAAMESFIARPDQLASMARASRAKAERRFDERTVNSALFEVLGLG